RPPGARGLGTPPLPSSPPSPSKPGCGPAAAGGRDDDDDAAAARDDDVLLLGGEEAGGGGGGGGDDGGFCLAAGGVWIYPTNLPPRSYQLRMAEAALFRNTLVCLPTGLGKTLVAAVLIYNFYRWFPAGKVVFLAPTKPLVAQQRLACARLMAIPARHMALLTGSTQALTRKEIWTSKRVLFLTPQVMVNDLSRGTCPAVTVKCLVVDEAHRALGNHAYCQVVRELTKYTTHFRVLALSATPGSDTKSVQQVVSNLLIGQIELRSEDSPDIIPYSHERRVEKLVVPLGEDLAAIQDAYIQVLEAFASPLIRMNVLTRRDISNLTKYQIVLARDQFRKNPSPNVVGIQQGVVEGQLALCISLYHGFELLQQMGLRSFYMFLRGIMDGTKGLARSRNELGRNGDFMKLYKLLEGMFPDSRTPTGSNVGIGATRIDQKIFYSHPKLKKLEEVVVEHFRTWKDHGVSENGCDSTRVMIFSSFRDSVQEIADMLHQHHPVIRAMSFVGHASGKNVKGFTQKEQLEVVRQFRDGGYNTLVSTCVGEEGLDIGEVDLIVCFDAQKSPIRLVQRMGRTGRKRQGRIVVILSEGREERMYNQSQSNRKSIYKAIAGNSKAFHFYQDSPRMVPEGINPKLHKMFITPETPEPAKPSKTLPRKSSLSSSGGKQRNLKEGWCLSQDEYEIWNQLYRLKESDQIQEIIFPRVQFASLPDEKEIPRQTPRAGTRELSLYEWRVWQNHPFPTHLVDHSDRCYHFISIMETIELMRHEEGECSYDLEIKPYLQMEDVTFPASDLRRSCALPVSGPAKPQRDGIGEPPSSVIESADGQASLSEPPAGPRASGTPQPGRRTILAEGEKAQPTEEEADSGVKSSITPVHSPAHRSLRDGLPDAKMGPTSEQMTVQGETSEKAETPSGGRSREGHSSTTSKCADSGYNSFTEKSSALSSIFYPPEEELFSAGAATEFYVGDHSLTQEMLADVERFLSRSPPPLSEIYDFEDGGLQALALKNNSPFPSAEQFHNDSPIHPGAHSTMQTQPSRELKSPQNSQLSKINLSSDVLHDRPSWDDIFDCDDEGNLDVQSEDLEVENHIQTNSVSQKTLNGERHNGACGNHVEGLEIDQEDSIRLFEDADDEFHNKSPSHLSNSCKILLTPDRAVAEEVPLAFQSSFSSEQFAGNDAESRNPLGNDLEIRESPENLWGESKDKLQNGEVYDNSKELFSINFDLGFCLSDSDDEILEQAADVDPVDIEKPSHLSGSSAGCGNKKGTDYKLSKASSPWGHNESETQRVFSTPLTLQNHRRGSEKRTKPFDPEFSPLSEAKERESGSPNYAVAATSFSSLGVEKMGSTPSCRPDAMNSSSKTGRKVPQTPATHRHRVNPRSIKKVLNSTFDNPGLGTEKVKSNTDVRLYEAGPFSVKETLQVLLRSSNESDDDVVFQRKSKKTKRDTLQSPEDSNKSDLDSPLHVVKKRRHPLNTVSRHWLKFLQFLDEEAELSQGDGDTVSSDESVDSENEQDSMLLEFLNDGTQLSQVLNDSEMEGVYLKSVHSPWMSNKYKMVHKRRDVTTVFSQIPEQDEAYLEDSFCVEEEEEVLCKSDSGEEICVDFNLLNEEFTGIRKIYQTRRAVKLKQARELPRKKLSRIIVLDDSSEEEDDANEKPESNTTKGPNSSKAELQADCSVSRLPPGPSLQPRAHTSQSGAPQSLAQKPNPLALKAVVSDVVDFRPDRRDDVRCALPAAVTGDGSLKAVEPAALRSSFPEERSGRPDAAEDQRRQTCILVDCREISSGSEIISSLKTVHKLDVEVCSLNGCDYIVSNRMAVERKYLSELLNSLNRTKLVERIQHLQSMFERICVIVEKDREKTGDTSRLLHRTKSYDSLLAALISAGIRILFSSCQEETADLLKELALVEQRKNVGIQVATAVTGSRQGTLRFYLTIPNVSYITALNMCHHFPCVQKMANSSLETIAFCAQVTHQKAEEIYRYIHYAFDEQMLPDNLNPGKAKPSLQ
uniref:ATP-dependent RNA helicase FANCM n=1 Tax=Ornithorhynchus anatinus TaxID=9258 RepID=F6TU70_ORNAN